MNRGNFFFLIWVNSLFYDELCIFRVYFKLWSLFLNYFDLFWKKNHKNKKKLMEPVGIEPETPGMLSQNHTPRPPLLGKKDVQVSQQFQ